MSAASIARQLHGIPNGRGWLCRCPVPSHGKGRGDRSPSLSIQDGDEPGRLLVKCFAGCDASAILDAIGRERDEGPRHHREPVQLAFGDAERTARALALWGEALDPRGTPVEQYLRRERLVDPPEKALGAAIRFHPSCPFAGKRTHAMVCLVRDIVTNEPRAVHRTALTVDGRKVKVDGKDRLALGPVGGGAIKLTPDEDVTTCLGIGEGVESVLSLRLAPEFGASAVWSLISAGGVERFPVLAGVESLWIAVDRDPAGTKAAQACANRWRAAGREVFVVTATAHGADLNDVTRRAANA
jgi:putative DNA primase/helicase